MATTSNLSSIIRFYAEKQKSPFIDFREFCDYVKKYAEHHVEENAELTKYLGDASGTVTAELAGLQDKHLTTVVQNGSKKVIVSVAYFAIKFAERYSEIVSNEAVPYPGEADLPKLFPNSILEKKRADDYIINLVGNPSPKSTNLYILAFDREIPSILVPSSLSLDTLLLTSHKKIRRILKKEEYHDYFLKKLRSSNPNKEMIIKTFFNNFVDMERALSLEVESSDDYYIWNQLCYFIRQDFEKIQDRTQEDVSILQAIAITEIYSIYLKRRFQDDKRREEALKELEANFSRAPYYYSMPQILKFQDESGRLLYGQYSEEDLREFLQKSSTEAEDGKLPEMVVFKVASGTRYYAMRDNIVPLVVRFCNEAHESIKSELVEKWHSILLDYDRLPEMSDNAKFELTLERQVEDKSPVLYALLNSSFMTVIAYENSMQQGDAGFRIFVNGKLLPYSDLLMIKREQILSEAKSRLPFVYTIPILSWIIAFFKSGKKKEPAHKNQKSSGGALLEADEEKPDGTKPHKSKEAMLAERAAGIASELIPEGSTVDRELNYLCKQWNKMISPEANRNLTEDVNSLIRDYTRKVGRTLSNQSFTKERVQGLAKTLVHTPNMQKIGEEKALTEYVMLYMLRLLENSK